MRAVALKGLWLRRGRAMLTAAAVVLGVAMVSGTFVLTDTISKAFDAIFTTGSKQTSAVISGKQVVPGVDSGRTLPASLLGRARDVRGVQEARPTVEASGDGRDQVRLVGADGKVIGGGNAPKLAFGVEPERSKLNPFRLQRGRFAARDGEVVVDPGTAERGKLRVGSRVGVAARGETRPFTVVGIAKFGDVQSIGGATLAVLDVRTAQRLLGRGDRYDQIAIAAAPGTSDKTLVADLREVAGPGATVRTGAQEAAASSADVKDATSFFRTFLLVFALIALAVGAFVIYNTLTITVAQRTRELATLRALGASRRQVRRSVLLEGLAIGVLASVLGLGAGFLLAKGLNAALGAIGLDLPSVDEVLELRTVVVALVTGVVVTVVASVVPARRATRIPPVAAMQEGAVLPAAPRGRTSAVAGVAGVLAVALLGVGAFAGLDVTPALLLLGGGVVALFVAVALLADRLVAPLAAVVGEPAKRLGGISGRLAVENAARNPARTARTAAALMIGLALVTIVATLGQGFRTSDRQALEETVRAPVVVTSANGFDPLPAEVGKAIARVPGAEVHAVRSDRARAFGKSVSVNGVDPGAGAALRVDATGGPALPGPGEAVVEAGYAAERGLRVGSRLRLTTPSGKRLDLRVSALQQRTPIQKLDPVLGRVLVAQGTFDRAFPSPNDTYVFVGGASQGAVDRAVSRFADVEAFSRARWVDDRVEGLNTFLNLLYVLLALSIVVSLFGMVNTLVLSVFERTREVGMLRAVGMSRRQVRRMVRHESIVTALIGGVLGVVIGLVLSALLSQALADEGLAFAVPVGALVVVAVGAVLAGVVAAIAPARRAARLDVLKALQYE